VSKRGDDDDDARDDDARAFDEAVRGARPLAPEGRAQRVPPGPANRTAPPPPSARREREELARGDAPDTGAFEIESSGETISGRAGGVDARKVRDLRTGHDRAEARLDLHGETRDAALAALERFVQESRAAGRRRVLVIHGRGSHSTEGGSILKPLVWRWLRASRVAAADVLAFTSGGPAQGGDGVTVLLLRKPGPR
jgi:DNA-nicking Smr family endonuclease